jgi:hypothetical protein
MKMRAAPTAENVKLSNADDGASDTFANAKINVIWFPR